MMMKRRDLGTWALLLALAGTIAACTQEAPPAPKTGTTTKLADPALAATGAAPAAKTIAARKPVKGQLLLTPTTAPPATETVQGALTRDDALLPDDGSYADYYSYQGRRGQQVVITLESGQFDAYLMFGIGPRDALDVLANDDDGGDGTNSRIAITLPRDGVYTIVANSLGSGETGSYVLRIGSAGGAQPVQTATPEIARNSTVQGRLERTDATLESDGTHYDVWLFDGRAGERVTATMRSTDFDTYLIFGEGTPGDLEHLEEDDDGAGGTDSRLMITIPDNGVYVLLANSFGEGQGAYSLTIESEDPIDFASRYPGGGDPNGKYALLVGIDDYPGTDSDLASPVADARLIRETLIRKFGYNPANIVMLLDEEATRDQIIRAFGAHLGQAGPSGSALFYYSGHGFQLESNVGIGAPEDPEPGDSRDEALYVWGYGEQSTMLLDDELGSLIDRLRTERTVVILDSCSSGSGTRGTGTPKRVSINPADVNSVAGHLYVPRHFETAYKGGPTTTDAGAGLLDASLSRRPHVLMAGSQDDDFSYVETSWPDRGGVASVFTYYLVGALEAATPQTTFRDLMNRVRQQTTQYTRTQRYDPLQVPQVAGELATARVLTVLGGN